MKIVEGSITVEETVIGDDGISCRQLRHIDLAELRGKEDVKPDKTAIKESLGVSSQEKGENVAVYLMERILGVSK